MEFDGIESHSSLVAFCLSVDDMVTALLLQPRRVGHLGRPACFQIETLHAPQLSGCARCFGVAFFKLV